MEDDQQFCLRWNNHQSTLIQNFDTLLESGTLVDCTLAAEGKYLKAHKVVLSACSPYFEGLLSEHYDKHPVFILKDVKFKELKAMMDYMYRGEVNISQDQLAALLKAAESLQIKGLSESKTSGSNKMDSRQQKVVPQVTAAPCDIPQGASSLTIEKNKVPRQSLPQGSVGDIPEDSASPQIPPKGLSSREGSQSPTSRKRKRFRRRSVGEDNNSMENHEASNSNDMSQQVAVPALGIAPVAEETAHADPADSIGRSALMTQLTRPADEMLQIPLEKPEPNDNLIEPKSEYMEDPEEAVEDLTLDDDMNDLNEMEPDNNRAGPSHDPSQHPAGIGAWHVTGDRSNAGGVVGSVAGAPGTTDEVFLAAQEAAQAHRDSQAISVEGAATTFQALVTSRDRSPQPTTMQPAIQPAAPPATCLMTPKTPGRRPTVNIELPDGSIFPLPLGFRRHRKISQGRRWTIITDPATGKVLEFRSAAKKATTVEGATTTSQAPVTPRDRSPEPTTKQPAIQPAAPPATCLMTLKAPGRCPTVNIELPDGSVHRLPVGFRRHRKISQGRRWTIITDPATGKVLEFRSAAKKVTTVEGTAMTSEAPADTSNKG